jgi:polysaccharide pyruvyl transferase WcaK-like protein
MTDNAFVLWGGFGGYNLGDEAILWSQSLLLRKLRPTAKLCVIVRKTISAQTLQTYADWKLEVIYSGSLRCLKILRQARLVVGGGQLVDDKSLGWPVGWTSLFLLLNRILGRKPIILFIGAEPVARRLTKYLVRFVYSLAQVCVCRDAESLDNLKTIGFPASKLHCGNDVVFSIDRTLLPEGEASTSTLPKIAVLIARDEKQLSDNIDSLNVLTAALVQSGAHVVLVGHDLREAYDIGALSRLEEIHKGNSKVSSHRANSVQDVLKLYSQCVAVISARMHPLILGSLVGALPIAIADTRKVRSLAALLGIPLLNLKEGPERQRVHVAEILARREPQVLEIRRRCQEFGSVVEAMGAEALSK